MNLNVRNIDINKKKYVPQKQSQAMLCFILFLKGGGGLQYLRLIAILTTTTDQTRAPCACPKTHPLELVLEKGIPPTINVAHLTQLKQVQVLTSLSMTRFWAENRTLVRGNILYLAQFNVGSRVSYFIFLRIHSLRQD